jgi:hypothetical protein
MRLRDLGPFQIAALDHLEAGERFGQKGCGGVTDA